MGAVKKFKIKIFDAKLKDAPGILVVLKAAWLDTYPNKKLGLTRAIIRARFSNRKERIAKLRKTIGDNKRTSRTWVAKYNNRVVAFCNAWKKNGRREISRIYILPKFQRRGIGRKLMDVAFAWLGGKHNIFVGVAAYNKKAISFYKKLGFKIVGKLKSVKSHQVGVAKFPEIEMVNSHNDDEKGWEKVIDFTKIKKGGIPIEEVIKRLK